jgi:hypothetical protein
MAGKSEGAADTAPAAPPVDPEVAAQANADLAEAPKAKAGWLRHIQTDTFHEVEDTLAVHAAYPGQYEDTKAPGEKSSKKIGWGEPTAE